MVIPSQHGMLVVVGGQDGELYVNGQALTEQWAERLRADLPGTASDVTRLQARRAEWLDSPPADRTRDLAAVRADPNCLLPHRPTRRPAPARGPVPEGRAGRAGGGYPCSAAPRPQNKEGATRTTSEAVEPGRNHSDTRGPPNREDKRANKSLHTAAITAAESRIEVKTA
jgi:hypothetical protein